MCGNAKVISMNGEERFLPYMEWPDSHDDSGLQLFPLGFSGVLYPTNSLHKDVTRSDLFTQLAPTNDDHWFKAMSLLMNSPVISLGLTPKDYPGIYIPDDKPLWRINKVPQQDRSDKAVPYDRSWKAILEYYSIEPSIFRPQSPSYRHRDKAVHQPSHEYYRGADLRRTCSTGTRENKNTTVFAALPVAIRVLLSLRSDPTLPVLHIAHE